MNADWLYLREGRAPLIVAFPHGGTDIPVPVEKNLVSRWLARKDTDWWIDELYDFAEGLGATLIKTTISRTVIDVNRDPSGASLYPGQATTALCPTTTFDGEALYCPGLEPEPAEIARRVEQFFVPYHRAITEQLGRLRERYRNVVLYDAHSIRSIIPRLFEGTLCHMNIGTVHGQSCSPALAGAIENLCRKSGFSVVSNGRFVGGWTTRQYGKPSSGIHAVQMELACRAYLDEPLGPVTPETWPCPYSPKRAFGLRALLERLLISSLHFATGEYRL